MRMESDKAGLEVVAAAKKAACRPAVAMLTAYPMPGSDREEEADKLLVKPMNTSDLLRQLEALLVTHEDAKRKQADAVLTHPAAVLRNGASKSAPKRLGKAVPRKAAQSATSQKNGAKAGAAKLAQAH
jgi:DNA-binding response OmpR family regulator